MPQWGVYAETFTGGYFREAHPAIGVRYYFGN